MRGDRKMNVSRTIVSSYRIELFSPSVTVKHGHMERQAIVNYEIEIRLV